MTLDDAILHLEETLADPKHEWSCASCREEHVQLLEWLKELKTLKNAKGDLISRDALKAKVNKKQVVGRFNTNMLIDNAPTVEERLQGKWKESHLISCGKILGLGLDVIENRCSVCGKLSIYWSGTIPNKFCPNCGAKILSDSPK